ncbi:ABC transporter ATP-binding protein [Roseovarius sp. 2305UL8-3]|uniref:ABC transporter ATP-binding protein n=1 Tax=Roseovarius conchicola TaxID=3121636 RepID=UPI0035279442
MTDILQLQGLRKTYGGGSIVAVDKMDLNVQKGEFVTFLGASGCGKTTTLRMIAGFEAPDVGSISLDGEDITQMPPHKRKINTVFQDYALFPHMTVLKNISYGLKRMGLPKHECEKRAIEALETVELPDKAGQYPDNLSGGQKQRIALARALVCNPTVLLLDEPLSALDAKLREAMQVELKKLHDTIGLTFILVTHDQTEAMVMSDRVVIMDKGRIAQIAKPVDLYERPATPYVADFIGTANFIDGDVAAIKNGVATVKTIAGVVDAMTYGKSFNVGQSVRLCVRPEKLKILHENEDLTGMSVISGHIEDSYFHGSYVRNDLTIGERQTLVIDSQLNANMEHAGVKTDEADVRVGIRADSVMIFG